MTDTTDPVRAALAELLAAYRSYTRPAADSFSVSQRWGRVLRAEDAAEAALSAPPYDLIQQMRSFLLAHRPDDGSPVDKQFGKMLEALSAPPAEPAVPAYYNADLDDCPPAVLKAIVRFWRARAAIASGL